MIPYKHTQAGTAVRIALLAPLGLLSLAPLLPGVGRIPAHFLAWGMAGLGLVDGAILVLLWSLTIEVTPAHFRFHFGPGVFGKTVPITAITAIEVCGPVLAWGIHFSFRRGWLYNVSGFKAVALTLRDGKKFMVGSDEPEAVIAAVEEAKSNYKEEWA